MNRLFELLFNGKKPVPVPQAVGSASVEPQRIELERKLREIDRSYKKIEVEGKRMKKTIDSALALAIATGGLK